MHRDEINLFILLCVRWQMSRKSRDAPIVQPYQVRYCAQTVPIQPHPVPVYSNVMLTYKISALDAGVLWLKCLISHRAATITRYMTRSSPPFIGSCSVCAKQAVPSSCDPPGRVSSHDVACGASSWTHAAT